MKKTLGLIVSPQNAEAERQAVMVCAKAQIASSDALIKASQASIRITKEVLEEGRNRLPDRA